MKRRFAALVLTTVLLAAHSAHALAATRDTTPRERTFREFVVKAVKQLKNFLGISAEEDNPVPPRPCTGTGCP